MTKLSDVTRPMVGVACSVATAALLCAGLIAGNAMQEVSAAEPKQGGTLVFARPEEPLSLTGFTISDNGSIWAIEQICDSLIEPDASGYGLRPALAESWDVSDDGLV